MSISGPVTLQNSASNILVFLDERQFCVRLRQPQARSSTPGGVAEKSPDSRSWPGEASLRCNDGIMSDLNLPGAG